jgi:endonuclease/exonuclease/phosphatase family metal-dependent hydrolase
VGVRVLLRPFYVRFLLDNRRYATGIGKRFHLPLPFMGYFKNTDRNLGEIVEFIDSLNPDVVGLVEVDIGSFRTRRQNQARTLASRISHDPVFQSKYGSGSVADMLPILNKQGNALLTNQVIQSRKFHYLNNGVKRLVIEIELEDVNIFLVHLSLRYRQRQDQLQDLYQLIDTARKPVIVAGDFNVFRGERELNLFKAAAGLESANLHGQPSHPSRSPKRQLDYILHSPGIKVSQFFIPRVTFSDHVPLVCDFDLPSPPPAMAARMSRPQMRL